MKEIILKVVNSNQGIKGTELALKVMSEVNPQKFNSDKFHEELSNLVNTGELIEIEYVLPEMTYRVKSFYLPKGTKLHVHKNRTNAEVNSI